MNTLEEAREEGRLVPVKIFLQTCDLPLMMSICILERFVVLFEKFHFHSQEFDLFSNVRELRDVGRLVELDGFRARRFDGR